MSHSVLNPPICYNNMPWCNKGIAWYFNFRIILLCIIFYTLGWTFSYVLLCRRITLKGFNFWWILTAAYWLKPWMQVRYAEFQRAAQLCPQVHCTAPAQLCSDIMDCIISANCSLAFFCNTSSAAASCSTITAAAKKSKGLEVAI